MSFHTAAMQMAGQKLSEFLARKSVQEAGKLAGRAAVETGIGLALEQGLPRAMGETPASSIQESLVRQGSGALISQGVQTGLRGTFPRRTEGDLGTRVVGTTGFIAGQIGGKRITDAAFSGPRRVEQVVETPTGATIASQEPESIDIIKPSTRDLSMVQAQEALSEREKYEYQMKIAQIKNQPTHSYMHYQTEPTPMNPQQFVSDTLKSAYSGNLS